MQFSSPFKNITITLYHAYTYANIKFVLWVECKNTCLYSAFHSIQWQVKQVCFDLAWFNLKHTTTQWVVACTTMSNSMCTTYEWDDICLWLSVFCLFCRFQLGSFCIRNIIIGTTGQFSSPEELTNVNALLNFELIYILQSNLKMHQCFNILFLMACVCNISDKNDNDDNNWYS